MITVFGSSDRDKVEKVLQKLCQIECISNQAVIEWACQSIEKKAGVTQWNDVSLEFDVIEQALQRESSMKWQTVTQFQQKPPTAEEEATENAEAGGEEAKRDLKMEVDAEDAAEQPQPNQADQAPAAKRRLTLEEYQEQFDTRMANEIQVFTGALLRLDKHADKNEFMNNFLLHLLKNVETSFITPKDTQQCLC